MRRTSAFGAHRTLTTCIVTGTLVAAAMGASAAANASPASVGTFGAPIPLDPPPSTTTTTTPPPLPPPPAVPTGPSDPLCATMSSNAVCQGGPYAPPSPSPAPDIPTSPSDPLCVTMPGDGACAGGPYALPPPPPPPITPPVDAFGGSRIGGPAGFGDAARFGGAGRIGGAGVAAHIGAPHIGGIGGAPGHI